MPPESARRTGREPALPHSPARTADRVHSVAIQLLRRLRREDAKTGLTGPRASALSVIVFAGPLSLGDLAQAEQVRPPTMTRLVAALVQQGLITRESSATDARVTIVRATPRGSALLQQGRARRVSRLQAVLHELSRADLAVLRSAVEVLERVVARL